MRWAGRTGVAGAAVVVLVGQLAGCGVVGPPIPPEDVGVRATIKKQKAAQAGRIPGQPVQEEGQTGLGAPPPMPVGQDEELPPLRPVGTR